MLTETIDTIARLEEQKGNPTFNLMKRHEGYNVALDMLKDRVIEWVHEIRYEKNQKKLREEFEDYLLSIDDRYSRDSISEVDDGYSERLREQFLEELGLKSEAPTRWIYDKVLLLKDRLNEVQNQDKTTE